MDPRAAVRALATTIEAQTELSDLSAGRLVRDLARVELRVRNGDYEKSPFEDNVLNLPDRTHQVTVEAEFMASVGRAWARVLAPLGVREARRVIDLGPGWAPKVELGLHYGGFGGHAVLLNKDATAIATLRRFLAIFDLAFSLEDVCEDLLAWRGEPADLVLGNHVLDDLLIDDHCRRVGGDAAGLYASESAFREAWRQMAARSASHAEALVERLAERLAETVAASTRPGGHAVFVQYPSYAERTLGLVEAVEQGRSMLRAVRGALERRGFVDRGAVAEAALAGVSEPFGATHCVVLGRPA